MESMTTLTESVLGMRRDMTGNVLVRVVICVASVVAVIVVLFVLPVPQERLLAAGLNFFLVLVLVVAIRWGTRYALLVSTLSAIAYSFAIPPAGHFHYDSRVLTLFTACLVTGAVSGQLSARVRRAVLEARTAEAAARRSEQELRDIIDTIPAVAWSSLPDGNNAFVNRQWTDYTGLSAEQTAGSGWQDSIHPDDIRGHIEKWHACVARGEPLDSEVRFRRADGQYRQHLIQGCLCEMDRARSCSGTESSPTSKIASERRTRCARARVIWRKPRGLRALGASFGTFVPSASSISRMSGIGSTDSNRRRTGFAPIKAVKSKT
jgi:PAS domain S-box-containing protein